MRTQFSKFVLAAVFGLAMAFTFSCDNGGSSDGGTSSPGTEASSSSNGTGGNQSSSSSSSGDIFVGDKGTFKDSRDGQDYNWVRISTQIWMAENLNYAPEQIGPTRGVKCYDDKEANCEKYGRLYDWFDALEVCPIGWHLPTISEWNTLLSYVGSDSGKKLKSTSDDWRDGSGTDDYGFGALPGGYLNNEFSDINISGLWWTSTENNISTNYSRYAEMKKGDEVSTPLLSGGGTNKLQQYSIRCVLGSSSSSAITYGELVDERDGQKYRTVKISTQKWMAQNLNYSGDGECYNSSSCEKYGRLYDWETAKTVCPNGWHLPTLSEWNSLLSYVASWIGKNLKAKSSDWGDGYGIDKYGFSALPGGKIGTEPSDIYNVGYWWTATENNTNYSRYVVMNKGDEVSTPAISGGGTNKLDLFSVRCVEN